MQSQMMIDSLGVALRYGGLDWKPTRLEASWSATVPSDQRILLTVERASGERLPLKEVEEMRALGDWLDPTSTSASARGQRQRAALGNWYKHKSLLLDPAALMAAKIRGFGSTVGTSLDYCSEALVHTRQTTIDARSWETRLMRGVTLLRRNRATRNTSSWSEQPIVLMGG